TRWRRARRPPPHPRRVPRRRVRPPGPSPPRGTRRPRAPRPRRSGRADARHARRIERAPARGREFPCPPCAVGSAPGRGPRSARRSPPAAQPVEKEMELPGPRRVDLLQDLVASLDLDLGVLEKPVVLERALVEQ